MHKTFIILLFTPTLALAQSAGKPYLGQGTVFGGGSVSYARTSTLAVSYGGNSAQVNRQLDRRAHV